MSDNQLDLNRDDIDRLLRKLGEVLARKQQKITLYVVGGANIALAVNDTRVTKDVDVVVKDGMRYLEDAAGEVAATEPGLAPDWINTEFTNGTYDGGLTWSWFDNRDSDIPARQEYGPGLEVQLASPEMVLALKTLAGRPKDIDDIAKLMRLTGIKTPLELGKNLFRFTGRRIFDAQTDPMMYLHIDPEFREIFNRLPPDLHPPKPPKPRLSTKLKQLFSANRKGPRCGIVRVAKRNGVVVSQTKPCVRRAGHWGPHRYG